jgi:hypothetical protein
VLPSASAFSFGILFFPPLRSFSSSLSLFLHHPVTSILPSIFPLFACFERQFVLKMWPIQLAFLLFLNVWCVHILDGVWTLVSSSLALQTWATGYCCERRTWFINNLKQCVVKNALRHSGEKLELNGLICGAVQSAGFMVLLFWLNKACYGNLLHTLPLLFAEIRQAYQ